ncbi:MAG: efflux RND transporter periplasmic adaptor subunit [Chthoniobacterales bacterium]
MKQPTTMRHALLSIACILAIIIIPLGCKKSVEKTATVPIVLATQVVQQDVPVIKEWVGSTDGFQNAQIRARVSGYLLSQNYQEGSMVKGGTVLFQIDPRPFQAVLAQTKASLAQAQARANLAQSTLARQTQLYNTKVISQQEFDTSTQSAQADIAASAAAQADVESAQLNVDYCTITAPLDGIVGKAMAQIGDLVGTGENSVLTTMSQVNPTRVYFPISEQEYLDAANKLDEAASLPMEKRQQLLEMKLANGETYPQKGVFDFVNRQVDPTTGTIIIAGLFPNQDSILRPGQYAKITAQVDTLKNAMVIPQQAVNQIQGTSYQVVVVNSENKTDVKIVKIGQRYGSLWVVDSGLKPGDKIIVEGLQKVLANGSTVNPQPYVFPGTAKAKEAAAPSATPTASPASTPAN